MAGEWCHISEVERVKQTPPHTRAHTTLPRRSNPGRAYTCVYFSTCVLVCYLWWVGLKQISTPLVQFKHTWTILHTSERRHINLIKARAPCILFLSLALSLPSHIHIILSLSSPFSLFILLYLGEHGSTKRPAWLYCCDGLRMSFTECKWRALHLSVSLLLAQRRDYVLLQGLLTLQI